MSHVKLVVDELEGALASGSAERRSNILLRVTDLFLTAPAQLTKEQTSLFDDVISRLVSHVERRALAELSARLAPIPNGPPHVIRRLASDDAIEVAGPVLAGSYCLTDQDLVEITESKSQSHLTKIAERRQLSTIVTDALVDHGNRNVVSKVAANSGARFSTSGMSTLVMRADGDDELVETIARRSDISPQIFAQLLSYATEQAREHILASAPLETRNAIDQVLAQLADHMRRMAPITKEFATAHRLVQSFSQDTELTKSKVLEFAEGTKLSELIAALSALSGTNPDLIGRLFCDQNGFGTMVLCKAVNLDWAATHAVLTARPGATNTRAGQLEQLCEEFERLSVASAQRLFHFWQGRLKSRETFQNALVQDRQ